MPRALDQDLRDRVIDAVLVDGMSRRGAALRFGVSASTAVKWLQGVTREDRRHPVGTGGHRPSALPGVRAWLLEQIKDCPDLTLEALCRRLEAEHGVKAVPSMLSNFFRKEGISFKKNRIRQRTGQT